MVKVFTRDGGLLSYETVTSESVSIDTDLGFLRIIDESKNTVTLIPWDNVRLVNAERPMNE